MTSAAVPGLNDFCIGINASGLTVENNTEQRLLLASSAMSTNHTQHRPICNDYSYYLILSYRIPYRLHTWTQFNGIDPTGANPRNESNSLARQGPLYQFFDALINGLHFVGIKGWHHQPMAIHLVRLYVTRPLESISRFNISFFF